MTKKPYATRIASIEIRQKIMDFIVEYRKKPPYFQSPTMQEIGDALPLSKTSVYHHLCHMEREGLILRSHTARGIVPAPDTVSMVYKAADELWDENQRNVKAMLENVFRQEVQRITPEPLEDIHTRVKRAVKNDDEREAFHTDVN